MDLSPILLLHTQATTNDPAFRGDVIYWDDRVALAL